MPLPQNFLNESECLCKVVAVSALCLSTSKVKDVGVLCVVVLLGIWFFCFAWGVFTIC